MKEDVCTLQRLFSYLPLIEAVLVQLYRIANSPNALPGPMIARILPSLITWNL